MRLFLKNFPYRYMEYEKQLALREVKALMPSAKNFCECNGGVYVDIDESQMQNAYGLVYFATYQAGDNIYPTRQSLLENDDTLKITKQHTRYSTHGIHEYKGKFNPQIVRCLMNILGVQEGSSVLDPFDGSGTTILECAHANVSAYGTDINPMANFIANTKVESLSIDVKEAREKLCKIVEISESPVFVNKDDSRLEYLMSWVPVDILRILETIRANLNDCPLAMKDLFMLVASDLIRDYSLQEPSDLRIRRRISPMPERPYVEAFSERMQKYLRKIEEVQLLKIPLQLDNKAFTCDIKKENPFGSKTFDAAITSPPYVTALPYIDTQRISLVWLGLCEASDIGRLESTLIGSREILRVERAQWHENIENNAYHLPASIYKLIMDMHDSIEETDGFRKKAMPMLTYRYFSEMKLMFENMMNLVKVNGSFALIVGHNRTTLGGKEFKIDTPALLSELAVSCGWELKELLPLQTYKRYGINSKNSIGKESLVILSRLEE